MQAQIEHKPSLDEIPRAQRRAIKRPLVEFEKRYPKNEAMARAYLSGQHTMAEIAKYFGVHYATVSRAVGTYENS
jgi:putative transposase